MLRIKKCLRCGKEFNNIWNDKRRPHLISYRGTEEFLGRKYCSNTCSTASLHKVNDVRFDGNFAYIFLHNKKEETVIDKADYNYVKNIRWLKDTIGYASGRINGKLVRLHVFILGKKKGYEIDHINRITLDNRRENLRFVTHKENMNNTKANNKICSIDGCNKKHCAKGLCKNHYRRNYPQYK